MRNKCPNIRVLQGLVYTRAKMRVYTVLGKLFGNMSAQNVPFERKAVRV